MSADGWFPVTGIVMALAGAVLGWFVPALIARIPEPEPEPEDERPTEAGAVGEGRPEPREGEAVEEPEKAQEPEEPKELYADIAARPGLGWRAALASGVCAAALGLVFGWNLSLLVVLLLVPVGVALAVVDWRTRLLPTWVIRPAYGLVVVTVLLSWLLAGDLGEPWPLVRALLGGLLAGGLYYVLWWVYPRGMGFGDVRLSGILGIALGCLGWSELVVGIYGGFLLGGVIGGVLTVLRRVDRTGYPFGPFMLVGALVGILVGQPVIDALLV
jgi:leader peptidase (prepilin peptidase) / N-methyltransferase